MAIFVPRLLIKYLIYMLFIYSLVIIFYLVGGFEWGSSIDRHTRLDYTHRNPLLPFEHEGISPSLVVEIKDSPKLSNEESIDSIHAKFDEQKGILDDLVKKYQKAVDDNEELKHKLISSSHLIAQHLESSADKPDANRRFCRDIWSSDLPPSSIYCTSPDREYRQCRIKNLYYHPQHDNFFIVKGNRTIYMNVPEDRTQPLVDLSSLRDHGVFTMNFVEVAEHQIKAQEIAIVEDPTYVLMRFHTGNIMHCMHDDVLGLYFHLKQNAPAQKPHTADYDSENYEPFAKAQNLLFIDGFEEGGYGHIFKFLTNYPLRFKKDLPKDKITCILDATVGQSKRANWYHYGFSEPQGPIPGKSVAGANVREVASYIMKQLGLPSWDRNASKQNLVYMRAITERNEHLQKVQFLRDFSPSNNEFGRATPSEHANIAIFGRRHDRLLKNEEELANLLHETFKIPVVFIRNEDLNFKQQVELLRHSVMAIGMHGSLLIMGMFLPPGSILLELYPYAVPGDNYSPYKTMCHLPGMELTYRNWINTNPKNNIPHPEYPRHHGGLNDMSAEEKNKILNTLTVPKHLCCSDPYWLFRIYQDTIADLKELFQLMAEAVLEASDKYVVDPPSSIDIVPAPLGDHVECVTVQLKGPNEPENNTPKYQIQVSWQKPWNVDKVVKYGIWCHQVYQEYFSTELSAILDVCGKANEKNEVELWVRPYYLSVNTTLPLLETLNDPHPLPSSHPELPSLSNPDQPDPALLKFGPWSRKMTCSCDPNAPPLRE